MVLTCRSLLLALFLAVIPTAGASTTWYVDGVNGNDGNDCKSSTTACKTIGHAISLASSDDSIMVAAATYTESITIAISLKVIGSSAATTIIDGGGLGSVVDVSSTPSAHVTISHVTIRNGHGKGTGGGIDNHGTLTISNSTITGNNSGTLFTLSRGGGIGNSGTLTVVNSTISGNVAGTEGGGIYNAGTLTVSKSTISGNTAGGFECQNDAFGGGIYIYTSGTTTVSNSTLSGNSAVVLPGCLSFVGEGGGVYTQFGTLAVNNSTVSGNNASFGGGIVGGTVQNTILANGQNCIVVTSLGYNLSSDTSCNFNNVGDLNNTDPKLGPLQNNGGATQTQALLSGSPAIDAGNPSGCTDGNGHLLKTDQRGAPRPDKEDTSGCDMGAYESQTD